MMAPCTLLTPGVRALIWSAVATFPCSFLRTFIMIERPRKFASPPAVVVIDMFIGFWWCSSVALLCVLLRLLKVKVEPVFSLDCLLPTPKAARNRLAEDVFAADTPLACVDDSMLVSMFSDVADVDSNFCALFGDDAPKDVVAPVGLGLGLSNRVDRTFRSGDCEPVARDVDERLLAIIPPTSSNETEASSAMLARDKLLLANAGLRVLLFFFSTLPGALFEDPGEFITPTAEVVDVESSRPFVFPRPRAGRASLLVFRLLTTLELREDEYSEPDEDMLARDFCLSSAIFARDCCRVISARSLLPIDCSFR
mmetsp:Transcript_4857/g.11980  ORF Transcript_4857/g.11980 Transcript_4857/m.11980 type:complete len:311 (+) Transcript_4857:2177-3109(+)